MHVGWLGGSQPEQRTTKFVPKLVRVARAMAGPLTASGNTSPTMIHEIGPKLICSRKSHTTYANADRNSFAEEPPIVLEGRRP